MMNLKKNNLGYTLVEITVTTAIVGALTAVAVPNFLRVKMNVNMEMVKQHLRIIGQNMNELYNQSSPHEYPENIDILGNSPEELSITASLNAIRGMGYDVLHQGGETFMDRAEPMPGMFGIAGTDCFYADPSGVHTLDTCWDTSGINMSITFDLIPLNFHMALADPNLSEAEKVSILSGFFAWQGMVLESFSNSAEPNLPATLILQDYNTYTSNQPLIEKVATHLQEQGIHFYASYEEGSGLSGMKFTVRFDQNPNYTNQMAWDVNAVSSYNSDTKAFIDYTKAGPMGYDSQVLRASNYMTTHR